MSIDKPRCLTCKYHELTPVGGRGKCYRFPPNGIYGGTPNTIPTDWCGEYQPDDSKVKAFELKELENKQEKK